MTTASNKAIVRAFIEEAVVGVMQGERDSFGEFLAPDIVFHTPRLTTRADHSEGLHAEVAAYAQLLADPNLVVDFVIAEDDFVAIHMTSAAHYSRPLGFSAGEDLAVSDPVDTGGMAILRVRDDRITDVWYYSRHPEALRATAPE